MNIKQKVGTFIFPTRRIRLVGRGRVTNYYAEVVKVVW